MANYRVVAPYVLLKVKDHVGKVVVSGFYAGAVVDDSSTDGESLQRHLDRGWVEPIAEPGPELVDESGADDDSATRSGSDEGSDSAADGDGSDDAADQPLVRPSQADPKLAWVDYAQAQGVDRAEAEAMTKADLIDLLK